MIITSLSILLVVSLYIILNQYFKILKYEDLIIAAESQEQNSIKMLIKMIELFAEAKMILKRIDTNGTFSTDDELGFVFKLIDSTIIDLNERLLLIKEMQDAETKEKK